MLDLSREELERLNRGESIWPEAGKRGWNLEKEIVQPLFDAICRLPNMGSQSGYHDRPYAYLGLFFDIFLFDEGKYPDIQKSVQGDLRETTEYWEGRTLVLGNLAPYAVLGHSFQQRLESRSVTDDRLTKGGTRGPTITGAVVARLEDEKKPFFHPVLKLVRQSRYRLLSSEELETPLPDGITAQGAYGLDFDSIDDYSHLLFPCND